MKYLFMNVIDIPNSQLVWEGWNNDVSAISCLYKSKHIPGKIFVLNVSFK